MLEAHALDDVGELDVDAEIVGIELELIAVEQAAVFIDVHEQGRDRAVIGDAPVAIARGIRLEIDAPGQALSPETVASHMHHNARSSKRRRRRHGAIAPVEKRMA